MVDKAKNWLEKQLKDVFCNSILSTIDGALLPFMYVAAINIKSKNDGEVDIDGSYVLSVVLLVLCFANIVIVPIVIFYFHKKGELGTEKRQERFGVAYDSLNYQIRDYTVKVNGKDSEVSYS